MLSVCVCHVFELRISIFVNVFPFANDACIEAKIAQHGGYMYYRSSCDVPPLYDPKLAMCEKVLYFYCGHLSKCDGEVAYRYPIRQ